jgi:hypothetical protein
MPAPQDALFFDDEMAADCASYVEQCVTYPCHLNLPPYISCGKLARDDSEVEQAHHRDKIEKENMSKPLFPMTNAENYFRAFIPSLERSDGTLRWSSGDGISELSVTPIEERTSDGPLVSEMVIDCLRLVYCRNQGIVS